MANTNTIGLRVVGHHDDNLATLYLLTDAHGSTRMVTDSAAAALAAYHYDAYGNALGFDKADALTEFLYSGEQWDPAIGQQYLRARYYDPGVGRFSRLDPFAGSFSNPLTLNKYGYTHGNPVMGVDPSGESFTYVELNTSIGTMVNNFATVARITGQVYRAINAVQTAIQWVTFVSDLALGGNLRHRIKHAWETYYSHLQQNPQYDVLFSEDFWEESAASFGRNSKNILKRFWRGGNIKAIESILKGASGNGFPVILPKIWARR